MQKPLWFCFVQSLRWTAAAVCSQMSNPIDTREIIDEWKISTVIWIGKKTPEIKSTRLLMKRFRDSYSFSERQGYADTLAG